MFWQILSLIVKILEDIVRWGLVLISIRILHFSKVIIPIKPKFKENMDDET